MFLNICHRMLKLLFRHLWLVKESIRKHSINISLKTHTTLNIVNYNKLSEFQHQNKGQVKIAEQSLFVLIQVLLQCFTILIEKELINSRPKYLVNFPGHYILLHTQYSDVYTARAGGGLNYWIPSVTTPLSSATRARGWSRGGVGGVGGEVRG